MLHHRDDHTESPAPQPPAYPPRPWHSFPCLNGSRRPHCTSGARAKVNNPPARNPSPCLRRWSFAVPKNGQEIHRAEQGKARLSRVGNERCTPIGQSQQQQQQQQHRCIHTGKESGSWATMSSSKSSQPSQSAASRSASFNCIPRAHGAQLNEQ